MTSKIDVLKNIAVSMKNIRKSHKLTQKQFAEKFNVEQGYITNLETGRRTASLALVLAMLAEFNISADWLFGLSEEIHITDKGICIEATQEQKNIIYRIQNLINERDIQFVEKSITTLLDYIELNSNNNWR